MEALNGPVVEIGVAARSIPGQTQSGDRCLVEPFPGGVLVAVVDGLGHGKEAAEASVLAVDLLRRHAREPVAWLLRRCHEELVGTRGAVVSLASFRSPGPRMTWIGVGNAEGLLLRNPAREDAPDESLLLRSGVVGARLPPLQTSEIGVRAGDVLLMATDGIRSDFARAVHRHDPPQQIADDILAQAFKGTDDALVLVARVTGVER
jgi:negative regulator of sigma-B (phosphoserine phosphatase)